MKIYHLCPSGKLWIYDQREVATRKIGEALFQKESNAGDVLKIDIPGQDTIKITKIININNSMGKKKSQFKTLGKEIAKTDDEIRKENKDKARDFFKRYTALTLETGFFINAVLEINENGISPKISVAMLKDNEAKTKPMPAPENPAGEDKKDEEPAPDAVAA